MRQLTELAVFVIIAALAAGVFFAVALAVGVPFHLRAFQAAAIAVVAVAFWLPAFANVHLAVAGGRETRRGRTCAAVRAFGLLLCSAAVGAAFLFNGLGPRIILPVLVAGALLNFGTLVFER